jgi:hypothetical protein
VTFLSFIIYAAKISCKTVSKKNAWGMFFLYLGVEVWESEKVDEGITTTGSKSKARDG